MPKRQTRTWAGDESMAEVCDREGCGQEGDRGEKTNSNRRCALIC